MSKHSPSPWQIKLKHCSPSIYDKNGVLITTPINKDWWPNAELIAKAPEMAEEIQQLKAEIEAKDRKIEELILNRDFIWKERKEAKNRIWKLEKENLEFRDLLWWNHGCDHKAIYGDDGEMQCNQCLTDFKRNEPSAILTKFRLRTEEGREILRQQELFKQALGEE